MPKPLELVAVHRPREYERFLALAEKLTRSDDLTPEDRDALRWAARSVPSAAVRFPTFCVCKLCGGVTSCYKNGLRVDDIQATWEVALMEYGRNMLGKYANPPPHRCACEGRTAEAVAQWDGLKGLALEDSDWTETSDAYSAAHGDHRFARTLRFHRDLSDDEIRTVMNYLSVVACPGYGGVSCQRAGAGQYIFTTRCDSSD